MAAIATHIPMRYRLAEDFRSGKGASWPFRLREPLPLGPRGPGPPPSPVFVSGLVPVTVVAITAYSFSLFTWLRFILHNVVVRRTGHRKFIWSSIYYRQNPCKIVVHWRAGSGPLKRGRLPRVGAGLFTLENAPDQIEVKDELDQHRADRGDRNKYNQRVQRLKEFILGKLRIPSRHAGDSHCVHWNKDAVDTDEGDPKMQFAELLIHEAPKHLREPKVECCKHAEDRSHAHHQVEMRGHKISIVHRQIQRCLA